MSCYASLTELKAVLGVSSTTDDTPMRKALEAATRRIERFTNRIFYVKSQTKYFNGASALWLPDLLVVSTLKTDEDGDGTFENTLTTDDYFLYPLNDFPKTRLEINPYLGDYASFGSGIKKGVEIAATWGYAEDSTPYTADTTLNEALDNSETGVDVTSATNLSAGHTILIDSEQMYIESISSSTLTVERGVNGTTAATHDNATQIYVYFYLRDIWQACIDLSVMTWENRAKKGLKSERLGDYDYTLDRNLETSILENIRSYRKVNV